MTIKTHKTTASGFEADLGYYSALINQCRKARGYILKLSNLTALIVTGFISLSSQAALYDRGNDLIYDDDLGITWLLNANYAQTNGDDTDDLMSWDDAKTWANDLSYLGHNDWRLPSAKLMNHSDPCFAKNGSCDKGYNNTNGELGHMFYTNLNNIGRYAANGPPQRGYGLSNTEFDSGGVDGDSKSFLDLEENYYWFTEQYAPNTSHAWVFSTTNGSQFNMDKNTNAYSWAVHDGDIGIANNNPISAVPIPSAVWLFSTALIGLAGIKRR